jgi:Xaa-Pro aminopeptidase
MNVVERIDLLRKLMKDREIDAYIIPSSDSHQSEYVPEHWKSRAFISGFTGSAGTVVVTKDKAGLWTDGRYYIQAEKQLEGSGIKLFKAAQLDVPSFTDWIIGELSNGQCVGFDGRLLSTATVREMKESFDKKNIKISKKYDLIDEIWKDRPQVPVDQVYVHDIKFAGKTTLEKLNEVRCEMDKKNANYYLLSSLDDIAWLFNLRGNDIVNNPVFIAFALVSRDNALLFIDERKVDINVKVELEKNGVQIRAYDSIKRILTDLKREDKILFDPNKVSIDIYDAIAKEAQRINGNNITTKLKSIKNDTEIKNLKTCQVKDGVAMVRFLYWLDKSIGKANVTEISAADMLEKYRNQQEHFIGLSFDTIAGYKDHAAMMHYKAAPETQYELKAEGMYLIDSGGQYLDGTTDITRTIVLGKLSNEEKRDFTLVLKGHIALASAKFLYGATGSNLDILARQPIWEMGIDYKCGTGHGVGFMLNVHEGPQNISQKPNTVILEKGMVITNEPGIYREGKYGIRTENVLLVALDENTEFGQFMKFETISYCPIDIEGIDVNLLNEKEKQWLNSYHRKVYDLISCHLNEEEREWLKKETREI